MCLNQIRVGTSRWESTREVGPEGIPMYPFSLLLAHCLSFSSFPQPGQSSWIPPTLTPNPWPASIYHRVVKLHFPATLALAFQQ